jgi:hypothetical protein
MYKRAQNIGEIHVSYIYLQIDSYQYISDDLSDILRWH